MEFRNQKWLGFLIIQFAFRTMWSYLQYKIVFLGHWFLINWFFLSTTCWNWKDVTNSVKPVNMTLWTLNESGSFESWVHFSFFMISGFPAFWLSGSMFCLNCSMFQYWDMFLVYTVLCRLQAFSCLITDYRLLSLYVHPVFQYRNVKASVLTLSAVATLFCWYDICWLAKSRDIHRK